MNIVDVRGRLPVHKSKRYGSRQPQDIRSIAIHHSLTFTGSAQAFAEYHVNKNDWPGIGYACVIDRDGTIYWCWDWTVLTYHVGNSNRQALGICLVGDFRSQQPTHDQHAAAVELVRMLQREIPTAAKVLGHSEYPGYSWKACPVIDMDEFRKSVQEGVEPVLDPGVANTIINTWIKPEWKVAEDKKAGASVTTVKALADQQKYYNWLANQLRTASGQQAE